jgi:Tfp pilus assembly protein PilF
MSANRDRLVQLLLSLAILAVAGLNIYAAFFPSGMNWGFHHLSFYPLPLMILVPCVMGLLAVPRVRSLTYGSFERVVAVLGKFSQKHRIVFWLLVLLFSTLLFWLGKQQAFFLGDGYLAIRNLEGIAETGNIAAGFRRQPFAGWFVLMAHELSVFVGLHPAEQFAFQLTSVSFGGASVVVFWWLARLIGANLVEQALIIFFLIVSGIVQFFFGYVENYTPAMFAIFLFLATGIAHAQGKVSLLPVALSYAFLLTLHFGMIILLPALAVLFYGRIRERRFADVVFGAILFLAGVMLFLWLSGYSIAMFQRVAGRTATHIVPFVYSGDKFSAYSLFSLSHVLDWINLQILAHPFAIVLLGCALVFSRPSLIGDQSRNQSGNQLLFIAVATVSGLAFTFLINCELGMSRDWDLPAPFIPPLLVIAVFIWFRWTPDRRWRRELLLAISLVAGLQTATWIGVNANEEKALARFTLLPDDRLWPRHAFMNAYEELGIFYRNRHDVDRAVMYFEKFLDVDSTSSRMWVNLGGVHRLRGKNDEAIASFERAVRYNSSLWPIYIQLGALYGSKGEFDIGLKRMQTALLLNPNSASAHNNIGVLLMRSRGAFAEALVHFRRAMELDPTDASIFYNTALCYQNLGDSDRARHYFGEYERLKERAGKR